VAVTTIFREDNTADQEKKTLLEGAYRIAVFRVWGVVIPEDSGGCHRSISKYSLTVYVHILDQLVDK